MVENLTGVIIFLVLALLIPSSDSLLRVRNREDAGNANFYALDFIGLVEEYGRRADWHNVTTEDGYILSLFRLLPDNRQNISDYGPPVFLQHGYLGSADAFVLLETERNLAFLLSDAGYDVWIGNLRGNTYGRQHTTLSPEDWRFWDFSMDDLALKDLPSMLDYVLKTTNKSKLSYIGISVGTTISSILLSHKPEYNIKMTVVIHLASVHYWRGSNPLKSAFILLSNVLKILQPNKAVEVFPQDGFLYSLFTTVCSANDFTKNLCSFGGEFIMGEDREQLDFAGDFMLKFLLYAPAGSSYKVLDHAIQQIRTGGFNYYDHENDELNFKHYGQKKPPAYNLKNFVAPLVIFEGQNDPFSELEDVALFVNDLPPNNTVILELVEWKKFNHIDYLFAKDVKKLVWDKLFHHLNRFNNLHS